MAAATIACSICSGSRPMRNSRAALASHSRRRALGSPGLRAFPTHYHPHSPSLLLFVQPVVGAEIVLSFGLAAARLRLVIVDPAHQRRQRHQNRFGAPASLQTEVRAAIIDQIEFDVAPAPDQLKLALALGV